MMRVRITCFTLASGEFAGSDTVVIGEIHQDDAPYLCNITPMTLINPIELGCVMGRQAYIAGWGKWTPPSCCDCTPLPAGHLRYGATRITAVGCNVNGRNAGIGIRTDHTPCGACMSHGLGGDSGGALCVEMEDESLRLVGITNTGSTAFLASAHQLITASGTEPLCRPCYPLPFPCADMNGDGVEDCADKAILEALGPRQVEPFCPGDIDGDGCTQSSGSLCSRLVANARTRIMRLPCDSHASPCSPE